MAGLSFPALRHGASLIVGSAYQAQMPEFARDLGHSDGRVIYPLALALLCAAGFLELSALGLRAFSGVTVGLGGSLLGIHLSLALSAALLLAITVAMLGTMVPNR
jgi:hypothetical protein